MISVGSRDGRKELEQRFSSNKRDMDEIELEEGEACSYQEEDDTSIDPDVALSYLDEKLQDVLGHFKKDFEGVVSAESLGAKYGTYGSFLPAYRRSPVLCHSRSPSRVQNHNTPQPLSTLRVEGGHHNSVAQANVPQSIKHGSVSAGSASSYAYKPPSQNDQCTQTARTQSMQSVEDCTPKSEVRDQRTLKVRIKVGSDKLSVKKNASIYSGLGLDGSPSPSFDASPTKSDSNESPDQILQMMISSPLFGGCLLSPLPDYLIILSERPKLLQDILTQPSSKASYPVGDSKPFSVENDTNLLDKKASSLQVKKDVEKETGIDAVSCEELVSNALKLPLLSTAHSTMGDSAKASSSEKIYSDAAQKETSDSMSIPTSLSRKADEKANSAGNIIDNTASDAPSSSTNTDTISSKSKKASKSGRKDLVKPKAEKPTASEGRSGGLPCRKEQFSSGDKKKIKKTHVHGLASRKTGMEGSNDIKLEHSSMHKILSKATDKYKDFFGDINEHEADVKTSDIVENTPRNRTSRLETHKEVISGTALRGSSHIASGQNGRPMSDLAPGGVDTEDNWVCCDKCQKWRLLPPGSRVDCLPEKWLCSMMTWLPDMNSCSISEEESTKAFRARYQLLHAPLDSLATGILDHIGPTDGKMIDKLRKTSKSSFQDSPNRIPSSIKKKQQLQKDRTLTEAKESPLVKRSGFQQLTKDSETFVETNEHKRNHKHRPDRDSDGGHAKMLKIKSKREHEYDKEFPSTSKKTKTRSMQSGDNDWLTARDDQDDEMLGVNSGYGVGTNTIGKDNMGNSELFPSQNSKHDMDGDIFSKSKSQVEALPGVTSFHVSKSGAAKTVPKKRKTDNFQDPLSSTPSSSKLTPDNKHFSRKKHKVSKSLGKESSASKRNGTATTSSSSKVSGSLKAKSKLQELKGSPVDSVSSSPLRISDADKITSGSRSIVQKDKVPGSPRKCSDVVDYGHKGLGKMSESYDNLHDHTPVYEDKERDNKVKVQESAIHNDRELSIPKSKVQHDYDEKRSSKMVDMEKHEHVSKSRHFPSSDVEKNETTECIRPHLVDGVSTSSSDACASDLPKRTQPNKKAGSQNGIQNIPSKHPIPNGMRAKNLDAPSPLRRDSSSQAAYNAEKEAKDLKHLADRLKKNDPESAESIGMYFEAALKFLHAASLIESGKTENSKHGDMVRSLQMYSSTAKLCGFCAREFEKSKDMATAALAYKCMEVAYLRVIYSSHHSASRDHHELQTVSQMVPPGESPSSSASDVDNLNNSATGDKAPQARTAGSPQIPTNLVIAARNRSQFSGLLSFAQNVNFAMEASRKSRVAFAAANASMDQGAFEDVIASVKTALDFNFHDVEGLLRLVRLAKEATCR